VEPGPAVLDAFGVGGGAAAPLAGGEGRAWRAGDIVLKPEANEAMVAWLAGGVEHVADTDAFRIARHRAATDGRWVVEGWAATEWLDGAHAPGRWDDVLAASRAFHAAIAHVAPPPDGTLDRSTQWAAGDRVAWDGESFDGSAGVRAAIERVRGHIDAEWTGPSPQVIHGDIGGNVLFADGAAPAVIDVSPYVRPAEFANAVAVVDAIAWQAAPLTLAIRFAASVELGDQLLARAVVYRLVAAAIAWAALPERIAAEVDAFSPVLTVLGPA
jgi:uncharacterized protein (TIGR02569 family)